MSDMEHHDPPFFIVGSARSGTTMLRLMLNRHSRLHVPPESWFLTELMNRLPSCTPLSDEQKELASQVITEYWQRKPWNVDGTELLGTLRSLNGPTLDQLVDAVFRLSSGHKPRWGDKTPEYVNEISRLHGLFPKAKFIHLIRDGRDVCLSLRRTGWSGDVTWAIANYWCDRVNAGCDQGRVLRDGLYTEVAYEDLVLNTETTLRNVCDFLEVPFEPQMREFHEGTEEHIPVQELKFHRKTQRPPRKSDVQRWRREMGTLQILIFEAAAADTMRRVGQKPRFPRSPLWAGRAFQIIASVARLTLPVRRRLGLHFPRLRKRF